MPELAAILAEIADRIDARSATRADANVLRKLAKQAIGDDPDWALKVHGASKGRGRRGAAGIDRMFAAATAIQEYRNANGVSIDRACEAVCGEFNVSAATLAGYWKKMSPAMQMDEDARKIWLFFKRLEAKGMATVTRIKPEGK